MRLKGKVALATGAGGGLGTAIAKRFATEGASILCADRDVERAEATNAALYLASDECDWVTGTILNVDGGYGAAGLAYSPAEIG
jgi:2-hydroxycyclohexanecarboxyl-CoA dehydrogenase